jgi:hypothetical protein
MDTIAGVVEGKCVYVGSKKYSYKFKSKKEGGNGKFMLCLGLEMQLNGRELA